MKRFAAALLLLSFLISGCSVFESDDANTVTFYYLEKEYSYNGQGSVIAPEIRETSGTRRDIPYLTALYLMGPTEEEHIIPLPAGTRIHGSVQEDGSVLLQLSDSAKALSDSEFMLASACLTLTCLEFTEAQNVTVLTGDRSITMNADSLTLIDNSADYPTGEETQ